MQCQVVFKIAPQIWLQINQSFQSFVFTPTRLQKADLAGVGREQRESFNLCKTQL